MLPSFIAHIITKRYLSIKQDAMHAHLFLTFNGVPHYIIDHTENSPIVYGTDDIALELNFYLTYGITGDKLYWDHYPHG